MYCDFNPKLFRKFISKGKKIIPEMASDWEMIPTKHVKLGGFSLKSKTLNQEIADIDLLRFLSFCKEQNLVIDSLKLQGEFVVGNDRSVYTKEMFDKWKSKYDDRTEVIIPPKDYEPGATYKTPCGMEVLYLGYKYVSKVKDVSQLELNVSNITKKYYVMSIDQAKMDPKNPEVDINELKQKFTIKTGNLLVPAKAKYFMESEYYRNSLIACWEDKRPKDVCYSLQPYTHKLDARAYMCDNTEYKYFNALAAVDNMGDIYIDNYGEALSVEMSGANSAIAKMVHKIVKKDNEYIYYNPSNKSCDVVEILRVQLINGENNDTN